MAIQSLLQPTPEYTYTTQYSVLVLYGHQSGPSQRPH